MCKEEKEELSLILDIILEQNYLQFNNQYFKQCEGLTMGAPTSATLAEISLQFLEHTIKHHLKHRDDIYQLQCGECPLRYIGQTGCIFRTRYRLHVNAIRTNKQSSKFAQYILETGHNSGKMDQIMEVIHTGRIGSKLNTLEQFRIPYMRQTKRACR
jgi:hypothetical protein